MMKVNITNFQSIEEVDLEIDGFTTIVGKSNIGKSSIIRAIHGAFNNKEGDDFVRDGKRYAEVSVDCPEIDLTWKKGGGHNDYVINGESLESVGRGVPPHIPEAGFHPVETSRMEIDVQVASQFSPIFLLDSQKTKGSDVAELISDIGRLGEIQEALRNCAKDRRSNEGVVRVREKDLDDVSAELEGYESLSKDLSLVEQVKADRKAIETSEKSVSVLVSFQEKVQETQTTIDQYDGVGEIAIPGWDDGQLVSSLRNLTSLSEEVGRCSKAVTYYDGVDDVEIPEEDQLDVAFKSLQMLTKFNGLVKEARQRVDQYSGLEDVEVPADDESLSDSLGTLDTLLTLRDKVRDLEQKIPRLKDEVSDLDDELENKDEEIHSVLVEAGECPTCGEEVE